MSGIALKKLECYDRCVVCPPDKSISVRAVILGAYAVGCSTVENLSLCGDVMSAVDCMRKLGADIRIVGNTATIIGKPFRSAVLDCGNSATAARLLTGLLSGLNGVFTIDGDASLRSRDMTELLSRLREMGADITDNGGRMPLRIKGRALTGGTFSDISSAQVKSALLLAGLNANGRVTVEQKYATRDHTENMLRSMNCNIKTDGVRASVDPGILYASDIVVPGDISAAIYPVCLALAVRGGKCTVRNVGLNATRTAVLDILKASGAKIEITVKSDGAEPVGDISVEQSKLRPLIVDGQAATQAIDEIPLLCTLACLADGISYIGGVGALRNKESDRIKSTVEMLTAFGADITPTDDGFIINGGKALHYGEIKTYGDHRIAMTAAVVGSAFDGAYIDDKECVAISYPNFFEEVIGV